MTRLTDPELDRALAGFLATRNDEIVRRARPAAEVAAVMTDGLAGRTRRGFLAWQKPSPTVVILLAALLLLMAAIGAALSVGGHHPTIVSDGPSIQPAAAPSGGPLPVVVIPADLHPKLATGAVEERVQAWIDRAGLPGQQGLVPPTITRLEFDRLGAWQVTVHGTFLDCVDHCHGFETATLSVDDNSGLATAYPEADWIDVPDVRFLDELGRQGLIYRPAAAPTGGTVGRDAVMTELANAGLVAPKGVGIYGPTYGLVECVDPPSGCRPWGPEPVSAPTAIWWVSFPSHEGGEDGWAALDAVSGVILGSEARRSAFDGTLQPLEASTQLTSGVAYTSTTFAPQVAFRLRAFGKKVDPGEATDWCSPADGIPLSPSARSIVLPWKMGCVTDLRIIRPFAVDCGTAGPHPDAAALAAAVLDKPDLSATDLGSLQDPGAVPSTLFFGSYKGRVVRIPGSASMDPASDPDRCRLLPDPASHDPTIEIRGDLATDLILVDVHGELVVIRVAAGGYDAPTESAARARGYDGSGLLFEAALLDGIYDIEFK